MRVFIGSSTEARPYVEWITARIWERYAGRIEPVPWTVAWRGGSYPMEQLKSFVDDTDAALLFMTPDDKTWYRDLERHQPRDNLAFEAGMFLGVHGRARARLLVPQYPPEDPEGRRVSLPSDLGGLTVHTFAVPSHVVDLAATGLPAAMTAVCEQLLALGSRCRIPSKLAFLSTDQTVERVETFAGSFRDVLNNGVIRLVTEQTPREIDIVVSYRIGEFRRVLGDFRKDPNRRLRVCFANVFDDALVEMYRRKFHDRDAPYMRSALSDSIRGILGPCNIEPSNGGVSISNITDAPRADFQIFLTRQRITYSLYRVDDVTFIVPLDMKLPQDPAPLAWCFARDTSPRTYGQYFAEYEQLISEAQRVYPT